MNIAYIITAYMDPKQLKRLVEALGKQDVYIHIDNRRDINPFIETMSSVRNQHITFISERVKIGWGGYSQVVSLINLLKEVRASSKEYDRVVCLSGTDYPAKSIETIENNFNSSQKFMNVCKVTGNRKQSWRVLRYWKFDTNMNIPVVLSKMYKGLYNRVISQFIYKIGISKSEYVMIDGKKSDIYFGSDYWSLTYKCCMYVLDCIERNINLEKYFRTSFVPSELMIQTIVCNSKYKEEVNVLECNSDGLIAYETLCALHYEIYDKMIKIFTMGDYEAIKASGKLFFRKAYTGISDELLDRIKKENDKTFVENKSK